MTTHQIRPPHALAAADQAEAARRDRHAFEARLERWISRLALMVLLLALIAGAYAVAAASGLAPVARWAVLA